MVAWTEGTTSVPEVHSGSRGFDCSNNDNMNIKKQSFEMDELQFR